MTLEHIGISALAARDLGLEVPDNVPDCAVLELKDIECLEHSTGDISDADRAHRWLGFEFKAHVAWSWVSIDGTVSI
jgi:hypothetical protein